VADADRPAAFLASAQRYIRPVSRCSAVGPVTRRSTQRWANRLRGGQPARGRKGASRFIRRILFGDVPE
jgi:hypothetical protein